MANQIFFGGNLVSKGVTELKETQSLSVYQMTAEPLVKISSTVEEVFNKRDVLLSNDLSTITPPKFGVIGHIDPTRGLLADAMAGIEKLRADLVGADSLIGRAQTLVNDINKSKLLDTLTLDVNYWSKFTAKLSQPLSSFQYTDTDKSIKNVALHQLSDISGLDSNASPSSLYSSGLFSAGTSLRNDIRDLDNLQNVLMNLQNRLSRTAVRKKNDLAKLDAEIPVAQRELSNLNQERIKALADYQVAKNLVEEDWRAVEAAYNRREKILNNNQGIYYARVAETPYALTSLVDLPLQYGRLEDLVPGVALNHKELPEDIEPFIQAVVNVPISNWKVFNDRWDLLPSRQTLTYLLAQRKMRMDFVSKNTPTNSSSKFKQILQSHQSIISDYSRFNYFVESSLQAFNRQVAQIISIDDLLTGTPHQLRGSVQEFRNRIDQATHSLLTHLKHVRPSLRLDWAKAAELDSLDLQNPQKWTGLEAAQTDDLEGIRTFVALVHWWWRQLNDNASSSSVTAVRNLLRAVLLVAAGDDPDEILHGQLQVVPSSFRAGDFLRVSLNRHAPIGTVLQLMNDKDQLIGKLRVEDADDKGSIVSVVNLFVADTKNASSQFSVIGMKTAARSFA